MSVHLIDTDAHGISSVGAVTDRDGLYEIGKLPEGTYYVAAGGRGGAGQPRATRVLHPGVSDIAMATRAMATRVRIGFGQHRLIPDIKLPADMILVTLTGTVRNAAGAAIPGVNVYVFDDVPLSPPGQLSPLVFAVEPAVTDEAGRHRITTDAGRYRMSAELRVGAPSYGLRRQEVGPVEVAVDGRVDFTLPD
jgi:hypothetical protein